MEFETSLLPSSHLPSNSIDSTSSPLEVLSNAAALALIETKSCDDYKSCFSTQQSVHSINKELPTKENKFKRNKDRRELAHTSSFRNKARSHSPPNEETMITERADHSLSPSISPALTSHYTRTDLAENGNNSLPCYSTYIGFSQRDRDRNGSFQYRGSPYHQIGDTNSTNNRRNSDPQSSASSDSIIDEEKPLDMSNKKYRSTNSSESQPSESRSEPSRSPPNSLSKLFGQQMMRPSVITCAPSLKSQTTTSSQLLSPNSKCHNCVTTDDLSQKCDNSGDCYISDNNEDEYSSSDNSGLDRNANNCKRHRQEIVTEGVSDPVIEEHFRRSLGKDYSEIFSNSTNNTSITYNSVDDHFAKALGDTWVRLQKTNRIEESSNPNNAQRIAS